jgi:N-acylneuraminate cytidylyltransferase
VIDGAGFSLLRKNGIKVLILSHSVEKDIMARAKWLGVDLFYGVSDKLSTLSKICLENNIPLGSVAGIGDDIYDIEFLSAIGLAACPKNAIDKVKRIPDILRLTKKGGEGAVREFIDKYILSTY